MIWKSSHKWDQMVCREVLPAREAPEVLPVRTLPSVTRNHPGFLAGAIKKWVREFVRLPNIPEVGSMMAREIYRREEGQNRPGSKGTAEVFPPLFRPSPRDFMGDAAGSRR
jgi:hypothetical protein